MRRNLKLTIFICAVFILFAASSYLPGFATPPVPPMEMESKIKITKDSYSVDDVTVDYSFGIWTVQPDLFSSPKIARLVAEQEEQYIIKEYSDLSDSCFKLEYVGTSYGCSQKSYVKFNFTDRIIIPREAFTADKISFCLLLTVIDAGETDNENIYCSTGVIVYYKLNKGNVVLSYLADPPPVVYNAKSLTSSYDKYIDNGKVVITAKIKVVYGVKNSNALSSGKLFVSLAIGRDNNADSENDIILDSFLVDFSKGYELTGLFKNNLTYNIVLSGTVSEDFFYDEGEFYIKLSVSEPNSSWATASAPIKYSKENNVPAFK